MKSVKNSAGFTLIELIIAAVMSAVVIFAISSIVIFVTTTLSTSTAERNLQMDMNLLANQIVDGVVEDASIDVAHGIRDAVSYTISDPYVVEFSDTVGNWRKFFALSSDGTVSYVGPYPASRLIYKAPAGATLNVVFSFTGSGEKPIVYVDMSVTQTVNGKVLTGSVNTAVYLRNAPQ